MAQVSPAQRIEYIENHFKLIPKEGGALIPMVLWPAQRHYIENRTHRDIILKPRQMGFSTAVMADNCALMFNRKHQNMVQIAHDSETSDYLLMTIERFHRNIGGEEKDKLGKMQWKARDRKYWPDIDSYIYSDSAKSDNIGIGHTIHLAHLTELARWPHRNATNLYAGVSQTVSKDGYITAESTPRGRVGLFYELWNDAKRDSNGFKAFFFPWWWAVDYILPDITELKTDEQTQYCADLLNMSLDGFLVQEKALVEKYQLTPSHLAWRRNKICELRGVTFFQEYPENDVDCWLKSEYGVFDGVALRWYESQIHNGRTEGDLTIWKDVIGGHNYVIGCDVASGQARDYSVASVLDARNLEYVARVRGKINTDLFAEQVFNLARRYNNAMIAVERAGHGHTILRVLLEKQYPNLYYHTEYDEYKNINVTDAGWVTSKVTRPLMMNSMIAAIRSHSLISYSENLWAEMAGLEWEGGIDTRVTTVTGSNDDEFFAVAIAYQVREHEPVLYEYNSEPTKPVKSYAGAVI